MTDFNQFHDSFNPQQAPAKKMPDMLNVLTILTFIGCVLALLGSVYNYFMVCKSVEMMNNMGNMSDNPMGGMMSAAMESVQKQCEMKLPLLLVGLVSTALCLIGALQMRKLKKTGFFIYTLGEVVAPIAQIILIGGSFGGLVILGMIVPVVFIILYATQLKHLS